jgi:isopenicillin-N epimerase
MMRELFLLDPDVVFLNHGSFGATPQPVFAAWQAWQRTLERQPVYFFSHRYDKELRGAREVLAEYLHASADDLAFVHNATYGVNVVARSLDLQEGDEVLTSDHEYGACSNAWEIACRKTGARYVRQPIPLPGDALYDQAGLVEHFWAGVTPRTKVIYLSHITSPTALTLPIAAICARARAAGILTVIDGAHAPGQIPLDLGAIDADVYTGNLHKWLCAAKGAAFLWVRPSLQPRIEPLVVSWGYGPERNQHLENDFVSALQWQGTDDPTAFLSVPAAIQFQAEHDWPSHRARCHRLLAETLARIGALTGLPSAYGPDDSWYAQMAIAPLPVQENPGGLKARLWEKYKIEVPLINWHGRHFVRISVQAYTTQEELDMLVEALQVEWK